MNITVATTRSYTISGISEQEYMTLIRGLENVKTDTDELVRMRQTAADMLQAIMTNRSTPA